MTFKSKIINYIQNLAQSDMFFYSICEEIKSSKTTNWSLLTFKNEVSQYVRKLDIFQRDELSEEPSDDELQIRW